MQCVFRFYIQFCLKRFTFQKDSAGYDEKSILVFM